jgi:WD40 repeat protein
MATILLAVGANSLWFWDMSTSTSSSFCTSHTEITAVLFTHGGRSVVTGGSDRTIRMWDVSGDEEPLHAYTLDHQIEVTSLAVSPNEQYLVIGDKIGSIWAWDIESSEMFANQISSEGWNFESSIGCISFSLD